MLKNTSVFLILTKKTKVTEMNEKKREAIANNFEKQFDSWYNNPDSYKKKGGFFLVGTTSDVLGSIGVKRYEITWDKSKIKMIMKDHKEMTADVIKKVPQIIEKPLLVLQSNSRVNSVIVFGELFAEGMPVLAAIQLRPKSKTGNVLNFAKIASAYGKDKVQLLINSSQILYVDPDKKRTNNWLSAIGVQFPVGLTQYGSINKITYYEPDVYQNSGKTAMEVAIEQAYKSKKKEVNMKYYSIDQLGSATTGNGAGKSARYTQKEYQLARSVNILEYLQDNGYTLQKSGKDWQLAEHNSLKISSGGKWYWYSRSIGGQSPIELLKQLNGDSNSIAAIKALAKYAGGAAQENSSIVLKNKEQTSISASESKTIFTLPERNINDKRAYAYLTKTRGLDSEIVSDCMAQGLIYEDKQYHNVVFVGQKDEDGHVRHANLRGTLTTADKPFKGDASGSNKAYTFALEGLSNSNVLYVCESAIDALSHATLTKIEGQDWQQAHRLALGGMSQASLDLYLQRHPGIRQLVFCLDNDLTGRGADGQPANHGQMRAAALMAEYQDRGYVVHNYVSSQKDLNEELIARKKEDGTPILESQESVTQKTGKMDEISKRLEAGIQSVFTSKNYLEYLKVASKFHRYSVNNQIMILMQRPDATRVAGYQTWKQKFGRNVIRGEHGLKILAPIVQNETRRLEEYDKLTGEKHLVEEEVKRIKGFREVTVFDVSQTEGKELPQLLTELKDSVAKYETFMKGIQAVAGIPIEFQKLTGDIRGFYSAERKMIALNQGMSEAQTLKTAIHELAHSRLHGTECNKFTSQEQETQAESVAFIVCDHFGLDTSEYSFPYIASWAGRDMEVLKTSLTLIQKEAGDLIVELTREMENQRDNEIAKKKPGTEKSEMIPVVPEEVKSSLEHAIWLYDPDGIRVTDLQRTSGLLQICVGDLEQNREILPYTYDKYLMALFREGFQKNAMETMDLFGGAVKDNELNQIICRKDPLIQVALESAPAVSRCMKTIQQQLMLANEIPGKVKVQINWSETDLRSGQFLSLTAANKIFGEYETQARQEGRWDQTQFALYVETKKGLWKYGESRMEFGSGFANDLMDFIEKTMPPEVVEKSQKTLRQQEKKREEQPEKMKKSKEQEKKQERVS